MHVAVLLCCRYNISTGDYDAWDDEEISGALERQNTRVYNGARDGSTTNRQISNVSNIYTQFGMDFEEGAEVSYRGGERGGESVGGAW